MHPPVNDPGPDVSTDLVVALLGAVSTRRDGSLVPLPGPRARTLLVALARTPGRVRGASALIEDVWGDDPPRSPTNALHTQISRLRSALPDGAVESTAHGYRLVLTRTQVDLTLARVLEQAAQQHLADGDPRAAAESVRAAQALWRGEPGADLPAGAPARELVEEAAQRRAALDAALLAALVTAGDLRQALPLARAAADRSPLDEQAHGQLMLVLAGLGLANEALDVFAGLRERLADRLGTDPSPRLVELNAAVLTGAAPTFGGQARAAGSAVPAVAEPLPGAAEPVPSAVGLRAAPNALLGRDADLDAVDDLLAAARVVTLLGPGGTGKTRLAHAIGLRAAADLPVALVELAPLRSGADVIGAISATLGLSEIELTPGAGLTRARIHDARNRLRDALSARPSLLILDNCEHLIDDVAAVVADLVAVSDRVTVLATSRAPLAINAEVVYPLAPLEVDESGSPATELFRTRARAVRPSVRLDPREVARLCRTLDGLPLAIELAAARVRTMSVAEINTRLTDRFTLLRSGDRTSPERHRTLRAVIDWSWNLLGSGQQAALRRLCRFPGGVTGEAAMLVAQWGAVTDAADAVEGLVGQSMLTVVEGTDRAGLRYHMLETVREFGEERLAEAGEVDEVEARTFGWAREFCSAAMRGFLDGDEIAVTAMVEAEHDNLLAVLRRAAEVDANDVVVGVLSVLGMLWSLRGSQSEVLAWAPRILAVDPRDGRLAGVPGNSLALCHVLVAGTAAFSGSVRMLATTRVRLREIVRTRTDLDPVLVLSAALLTLPAGGAGAARILAEGVRHPDPAARSAALMSRANLRENNGDLHGSRVDALAALALARESGQVWTLSMVCQHLGSLAAQAANYEEALGYYREGVELLGQLRAYDEALASRTYLTAVLVGLGRVDEARRELERAGNLAEIASGAPGRFEDRRGAAVLATARAEIDLAAGEVEAGLRGYRRALGLEGGPEPGAGDTPDPFGLMVMSAAVDAHVLAGRAGAVADIVAAFTERVLTQLGPAGYPDLPQTGAVACAVGGFDIATGDPDAGLRLLALSTRVSPRQDFPVMQVSRHLERARAEVGADRVDAALAAVAGLPRSRARRQILDAFRTRG
ncbi:BTAD domain-containing putative transcriptional regulator [Rhodococcus sp. NPDC058505]|uniref:AfsR/SARP family transcriptional regulator n=1 Tax=unclassified Rhodococcus (in: high G+C Gram-positive bacteria) TaxID=192944 RepID=UPI003664B51A